MEYELLPPWVFSIGRVKEIQQNNEIKMFSDYQSYTQWKGAQHGGMTMLIGISHFLSQSFKSSMDYDKSLPQFLYYGNSTFPVLDVGQLAFIILLSQKILTSIQLKSLYDRLYCPE